MYKRRMSHFDWKLLRRKKVIPTDRHSLADKDETSWNLTTDQIHESKGELAILKEDEKVKSNEITAEKCESQSSDQEKHPQQQQQQPQDARKSKSRKVKSYLKRCKGALTKSDEISNEKKKEQSSSWYVDDKKNKISQKDEVSSIEVVCNNKETAIETENVLSGNEKEKSGSKTSLYEDARDFTSLEENFNLKSPLDAHSGKVEVIQVFKKTDIFEAENIKEELEKCDSSDTLIADSQVECLNESNKNVSFCWRENVPVASPVIPKSVVRGDAASIIRSYLGPIYGENVLDILTRQARDILVCAYHGNLENFVKSYLLPAVKLLSELKRKITKKGDELIIPKGWPLTLGNCGLVLRLGELEASSLRLGECYICVRSATANTNVLAANADAAAIAAETSEQSNVEIALVWRATSMRAPGLLGWDREDEFMDWRERQSGYQELSSNSNDCFELGSTRWRSSYRRRTRDETDAAPARRPVQRRESRSTERRDYPRYVSKGYDVLKSRSSSSVDAWAEEVRAASERRAESSSRSGSKGSEYCASTLTNGIESKNKLKRNKRVVSPAAMEKWKETTRSETRSKILALRDLASPVTLENVTSHNHHKENHSSSNQHSEPSNIADSRYCNGESKNDGNYESNNCGTQKPEDVTDLELPGYISHLLVTVERKIERVSIDDLTFPCTACRNIDTDDPLLGCKCAGDTCDCESETICECSPLKPETRSFEVAGIKHIDSDDEEEVRMGFGTKKKVDEVTAPKSIHDLSERALNCGLTYPGYTDSAGRPVLEFDGSSTRRDVVSSKEMASFLLYLANLPRSTDVYENELTLLVTANSKEEVDTLDRALNLVKDIIKVQHAYVLQSTQEDRTSDLFSRSKLKTIILNESTLEKYISRRNTEYNHEQCIAFYKEYDSIMAEWQTAGRRLALEMSELKECTSMSGSLTPLSRLLTDPTLRRTSRDADEAMSILEERASLLSNVEHVTLSLERARRLVEEVGNASTRLESSFESRRATIRNLAVLRSIEDQAREVLSWLCKKGEEVLAKHAQHSATNLPSARSHEREFEKFYFTSMRHLDKGSDLAEAASASGLRELARSLKHHLRGFGARLEDRREYLEDTSRCCLLQDRAYEWAQEARIAGERRSQQFLMARPPLPAEHFQEMMALAEKLGNEILIEQCRMARNKCMEALDLARSSSEPGSPARRRSIANSADSTNSWDESLGKRGSWDDSDSNASYAGPMESIGSGGSGGRPTLDNIAELRESSEQLLDCSPPRTPSRSPPPPRRFAKPPVNSHLHRAPSIAPGMKAKKTILLIMREMIQTERDYVTSLEYIIENYIPELVREDIPQSLRGQRNVIFGNVEKIYEFHSQYFLRELEQCEHSPMMVGQCFLRHEKKFYLYALYNKNKPNSDSLMAEYGSTFFKAKQMELGDKMDLASYLLKPVQRMGKYALLLQQLVKAGQDLSEQLACNNNNDNNSNNKDSNDETVKPIFEGETDLRAAEQMVRFQLRHGNDLLAMDSLRDCDVNVKEQGRLLRQNEFLVWQGKGKKCLRQVFLFEDLILFSKARRFPDRKNLDIYIYKHSIKTTDIGLTAVIADSPTKFEIWFRKRKPGDTYTLQCASEDIKKAWTEELSNLLWKQALRNREVRMAEMSSMGIGNKPCLDIRPSADQINDRSISLTQLSKTAARFRNSIAVSHSDDSGRSSRRPHSVISVSSSSSSGGSSGPPTTLNLGLDASPRLHHRSTTLNSQCSVESGIIADISIISDDGGDGTDRSHWNSTLESPISQMPTNNSTPLQSPTSATGTPITSPSSSEANLTPYDQDVSINL